MLARDALDDPTWLRSAYVFTLDREPDAAAWTYYLEAFAAGRLERDEVLDTMRHAVERRFQVNPRDLLRSVRAGEAAWVRSLPPATSVLDLRTGHAGDERSLIGAGWPGVADVQVVAEPPPGARAALVVERRQQVDVAQAAASVAPGGTIAVLVPNAAVTALPVLEGALPPVLADGAGTTMAAVRAELASAGCEVVTEHGLNWARASVERGALHLPEVAWRVGVHGAPEECLVLALTARRA